MKSSATLQNMFMITVSPYVGFLKYRYPQIIPFNGIFHSKTIYLGVPHLWTPPYFHSQSMESSPHSPFPGSNFGLSGSVAQMEEM